MSEVRVATGSGTGPNAAAATASALSEVLAGLDGDADLVVAFIGAAYAEDAAEVSQAIRTLLAPQVLVGMTAGAVLEAGTELERPDALSLWAARVPDAELTPLRYAAPADPTITEDPAEWAEPPLDTRALVLLADPFSFPGDVFLTWLDRAQPGLRVSGGLASAGGAPGANRLLLDGDVHDRGAVGVAIGGDVAVRTLVSQGCRPVGESYVVTRAEGNVVLELGGRPGVDRVKQMFTGADPKDRRRMRGGLHIGTVIDEYAHEYGAGDFLIRTVLGAQQGGDGLVVGDVVRVGQTVQFQVRDAESADSELSRLLTELAGEPEAAAGALLFTCNGRGGRMFGVPDHDASTVQDVLGPLPLAGCFCAGEFGPVGSRSFLHGFTASLLVLDAEP